MHGNLTTGDSVTSESFNTSYVWMISTVAALGGLLFGYDWVVIGGAKPFYEKYFNLNSEQLIGWANSCALIGCLIGSLISGAISDRMGRKKLLIASACLFAVSSIFTGLSPHIHAIRSLAYDGRNRHRDCFECFTDLHFRD